ncbi:hypothetical protein BS50DRAFT_628537 [Corynespora cassiicola Philippines]|uniref:Uncharacterized protein n=1 Tax=Corynespora cassiicola Philippines TaxID=1448308 RepID=A0A2T2PCG5_CORCC|nr:hypothetical protein BS50DRAFT_628537 [Corynespora cassiicola Philippines]
MATEGDGHHEGNPHPDDIPKKAKNADANAKGEEKEDSPSGIEAGEHRRE